MTNHGTFHKNETGQFSHPLAAPEADQKLVAAGAIAPASAETLIRLRLNYKLYLFNNGYDLTAKYLLADLNGTEVSPGPQFNVVAPGEGLIRGWFTTGVNVSMGFVPNSYDLQLLSDSPQTTALQGSQTSSITQNLGLGFFGLSGTANANVSITNSFTYSVTGFEVTNTSNTTELLQSIPLTATKSGPYTGLKGMWSGPNIAEPPERAMSNLGIPCQGLWLSQAGTNGGLVSKPISVTVPFKVIIEHELGWCQSSIIALPNIGTSGPFSMKYSKSFTFNIDFSTIET